MADTVSSAQSYSLPMHGSVPILPSQERLSGRMPNDNTLSGSIEHRRCYSSESTGDRGRLSSASRYSPNAQHPPSLSAVGSALPKLPNRGVRVVTPVPGSSASSSSTAIAVKAKRKRSMIACRNCNERRVRCDGSITGLPCTTCKSAGRTDCAFIDSKRVRCVKRPLCEVEAVVTV